MSFKYYIVYEDIAQLEMLRVLTAHSTALDFCSPDILKLIDIDKKNRRSSPKHYLSILIALETGYWPQKNWESQKPPLLPPVCHQKYPGNDLTDGETNYTYMFTFRTLHYLGIFQLIDL